MDRATKVGQVSKSQSLVDSGVSEVRNVCMFPMAQKLAS
jgi:hypothetical protein